MIVRPLLVCLHSLFLHSVVLYLNGCAYIVELTISSVFLLISWHASTITTPPIQRGLTSQICPTAHLLALFSPLITNRFFFPVFSSIFTEYLIINSNRMSGSWAMNKVKWIVITWNHIFFPLSSGCLSG